MKFLLLLLLHSTQVSGRMSKNRTYKRQKIFLFFSHPLILQAARVHNSAATEATEVRRGSVLQTFNSKQLRMIQETVWFEDSPRRPSISNHPRTGSTKSPSSRCPPGCWPLIHLNLGHHGLNPGTRGLSPTWVRGLVPPPWGFHPTTASPVPSTSTSTRRSNIYLRL